jgi:hypothetical protein
VLPRYKNRLILLDQGALVNALRTATALSGLKMTVVNLPAGVKDPGDLNRDQFIHMLACK